MDHEALIVAEVAALKSEVVEQMILNVEGLAESRGWDRPASLVALAGPLTLTMLAVGTDQEVDDDAVVGAVSLASFGGHMVQEFLVNSQTPDWALGLLLTMEVWSYPPGLSKDVQEATLPWDHADPGEARFSVCVLRDGRTFWAERRRGEDEVTFRRDYEDDERLISSLQRALGLPTAPPTKPVELLAGRLWLSDATNACEEALKSGHPLAWDGEALAGGGVRLVVDPQEARASTITSSGWEGLRQRAAVGAVEGIEPAEALWMDEGIFARLVLAGTEAEDQSLRLLEMLTDEESAKNVRMRLESLGWLPREDVAGRD